MADAKVIPFDDDHRSRGGAASRRRGAAARRQGGTRSPAAVGRSSPCRARPGCGRMIP